MTQAWCPGQGGLVCISVPRIYAMTYTCLSPYVRIFALPCLSTNLLPQNYADTCVRFMYQPQPWPTSPPLLKPQSKDTLYLNTSAPSLTASLDSDPRPWSHLSTPHPPAAMAKLGAPVEATVLQALLDDMVKPGPPAAVATARAVLTQAAAAAAAEHAAELAATDLLLTGRGGRLEAAIASAKAAAAAKAAAKSQKAAADAAAILAAAPAKPGPTALSRLSGEELGMLASVLSIYGYSPRDAWLKKFAK